MKLTFLLLTAAFLHVSAGTVAQKVTFTGRDVPLTTVFSAIERQTGFSFFYNNTDLATTSVVTLHLQAVPLQAALEACLKDQHLDYAIKGKTIFISARTGGAETRSSLVSAPAPPMEVHGQVADEQGGFIEGATITVKGTKQVIAADSKGHFMLDNIDPNAILMISCVGYETVEISLKGRLEISINLRHKNGPLDEVQVIAYGTVSKRFNIGNVTTVKEADIESQPVANPLLALEGRVTGLFVTQANGLAGGGVTVRVQGQNSIQNGSDPLYVVDGVPYPSQLPSTGNDNLGYSGGMTGGVMTGNGSPMSYLDPSDIESIDVLKDADATAIYGSRAANGAILITTKKGKAGPSKFDINAQEGWGKVAEKLKMMNTSQYLAMRLEGIANNGRTPNPNKDYDLLLWDTTRYTDWQKTLLGGSDHYTNISGNVSGGNSAMQYLIGGTYHRETTVFPLPFADQKANIHFNINAASHDQRFHIQLSGMYMVDNNQLPGVDLTGSAITLEPDAPKLYNSDGTLNWMPNADGNSTWTNPLAAALYQYYKNKTSNLVSNALLSYQILSGLEIRSSFGYTNMQTNDYSQYPSIAIKPENRQSTPNASNFGNRNLNTWIAEPQLEYKKMLGSGRLDALLGSTFQQNNSQGGTISGSGYSSDQQLPDIQSAAAVSVNSTFASQYRYDALFGRLNYIWRDKYIIDLTGRRDGSSRFGANNRFHNFGAIGGAWIFSNENAIHKALPFLSFGKIRGSYGTTGSDQIGDFLFLNLYQSPSLGGMIMPYQGVPELIPDGLPNPYLEWEQTKKEQIGMDLGVLKERILFTATYSVNRSSNQLLPYSLPQIAGFTTIVENFPATVQNTDIELTLNTINIKTKKFNWSSSINLTVPQNKLVAFPNLSTSSYANSLVVGQPVNVLKVYHFLGVNDSTGQYVVADSHGSPTSSPNYLTDANKLVSTFPKLYGGFTNSFGYKSFRLDFLFQFVKQIGPNIIFQNGASTVPPGAFSAGLSNQPVSVLPRWQKPGDQANIQMYSSGFASYNTVQLAQLSDASYRDASYIRLKNISLSWQLPKNWLGKAGFQNARIYAQAQNLLTITSYKGLDPETQSVSSLPPLRVITMGLQVGF